MQTSLDEQQTRALPLGSRATLFDQLLSTPFLERHLPRHCKNRLDENPLINRETGELTPHGCGALGCPYCVKVKRRQVARAAGASDPTAFLTLTLTGESIAETCSRMDRLRKNLRKRGYPLEWVWVVECFANDEQSRHKHHVHALAHGNVPPEFVLSEQAQHVGFGVDATVRAVGDPYRRAGYLWSKRSKWRTLDTPHRLWTNGGHVHHATHGYWRLEGERVRGGYKGVLKGLRDQ